MLSFDPAILDKFSAEYTFEADMFEIVDSSTYRSNSDVPLYYNSNKFLPIPFEVPDVSSVPGLQVDTIEITMSDLDSWFTSYFLNQNRKGERVILYKYYDTGAVAPYLNTFINNFLIVGNKGKIILTTEFALWKKKSLRYPASKCPWPFKVSVECGYTGSAVWCDQTRSRCKALGNYANFGGRRYIQDIEGKKIYWGKDKDADRT